jgi:hypothetical protein
MMRHRKLIVAIFGVLALTGLGIALAAALGGSSSGTAVATAALTPPQQVRLEKGITAPTVASQSNVIATELRSQFDTRGKPLLPTGSHVSINDATFHTLSAQLATVDAVVSGPDPGRWQLVLVREAGRWQLLSTRKLS